MTAAMNGAQIVGMIGATMSLINHMVDGVGTRQTAEMTDTLVTDND